MLLSIVEGLKNYFSEFKVLKHTPREFWNLNLVINFFEMLAYFSFITVLAMYLSENVGFDDQWAGNVVGIFSFMITIIIFFSGPIIDSIGVKRALFYSMLILIPCRLFMGLIGPFENWYLDKNLDLEKARSMIVEQDLQKKVFTHDTNKLIDAQVEIVMANPDLAAKNFKAEELRLDSMGLRENLILTAAKSEKVKNEFGEDLATQLQDQEKFKSLVVMLVGENPAIAEKYYVDLDKAVAAGEVEFKKAIINIVTNYPELRSKLSIQETLKIVVFIILIFTAMGEALMVPAIYAALRMYTNKRTSGTAFNFQYLTMNIGAVLSYVMFDFLRNNFGNESILLVGSLFAVICAAATLFLRSNITVTDEGEVLEKPAKTAAEKENPLSILIEVIKEPAFWRFMFFLLLLIGVKLVFTHQFMVMPKYYDRVLGPDAPIGLLNAINPAIIVAGLILFIPIVMKFTVFRLIIVGTFVSASSVFFLAIPAKFFLFLGWTYEQGFLTLILLQIVVFAFGELIWSPRLSEYTVTIAPRGREGTYMSLAALPFFIAKPLNGWLSGLLLTEYCPEGVLNDVVSGARQWYNGPEMMWLIFGIIAISSPILVVTFRKFIRKTERQKDEREAREAEEEAAKKEAGSQEA